jgi:hypothetical protein
LQLDSAVFVPAVWAIEEDDVDRTLASVDDAFKAGKIAEDLLPSCRKNKRENAINWQTRHI